MSSLPRRVLNFDRFNRAFIIEQVFFNFGLKINPLQDTYTVTTDLTCQQYFRLLLYTFVRTKAIRVIFCFVACIAVLDGILKIAVPGKNGVNLSEALAPVILAPLVPFLFF